MFSATRPDAIYIHLFDRQFVIVGEKQKKKKNRRAESEGGTLRSQCSQIRGGQCWLLHAACRHVCRLLSWTAINIHVWTNRRSSSFQNPTIISPKEPFGRSVSGVRIALRRRLPTTAAVGLWLPRCIRPTSPWHDSASLTALRLLPGTSLVYNGNAWNCTW